MKAKVSPANYLFAAVLVVASTGDVSALSSGKSEYCSYISEMAKMIMDSRQEKLPMSALISHFEESIDDGGESQYLVSLVVRAYETPAYSSASYKVDASFDFRNEVYLECFKNR